MEDIFRFADEMGPAKVIHIFEPSVGLRAVLVVDNVACGPSIGGVRMAPDVSTEEAFWLARSMTFKNAAVGLSHGSKLGSQNWGQTLINRFKPLPLVVVP